jgi:hypothetical protein
LHSHFVQKKLIQTSLQTERAIAEEKKREQANPRWKIPPTTTQPVP